MAEETLTLAIEGMHCDACVRRVTGALTSTGLATVDEVRIGAAKVQSTPGAAPALLSALERAGFTARVQP